MTETTVKFSNQHDTGSYYGNPVHQPYPDNLSADPIRQPRQPTGPSPPPPAGAGYVAPVYHPSYQPGPPGAWPSDSQPVRSDNNVMVVGTQPTAVPSTTVHVTRNDRSLFKFGLVMTVVALVFFCWWSLACTIPGAVMGYKAATAGRKGNDVTKKKYDRISRVLTLLGIVFQVTGMGIIIAGLIGIATLQKPPIHPFYCSTDIFGFFRCQTVRNYTETIIGY